jgi:hypothetical protein
MSRWSVEHPEPGLAGRLGNRAASRHYTDTYGAAELLAQGETLHDKLLVHIAPVGCELISSNGDYLTVRTAQTEGSALRNLRSAFLDAA